jgi:hypothetical protein
MKKSKLIAGILLMILGIGISIGSVVFHYKHGQYGMINQGHKIVNRQGMMGGFGFKAKPNQNKNKNQNQGQGQNPTPSPQPNQNQNNDQNSNGG